MHEQEAEQRNFRLLLLAVAAASLVPTLIIATSQFLSYDGYWHVFIATQNRWRIFVSEWKADAHPPLFYLLLRFCAKLSRSRFAYRIPSVVPGVASIYLLGLVARRLFSSSALALVGAGAYGLSTTLIEIFCDVRGYALALFFVIASFWCLVTFLEPPAKPGNWRALLAFSVLVSLGILTEYYVVFFLAACVVLVLQHLVINLAFREHLAHFAPTNPVAVAAVCVLPSFTMAWLYVVHLRIQPSTENNVLDFYWTGHNSLSAFIWSGIRSDLAYLMPFGLDSLRTASLLAALILSIIGI